MFFKFYDLLCKDFKCQFADQVIKNFKQSYSSVRNQFYTLHYQNYFLKLEQLMQCKFDNPYLKDVCSSIQSRFNVDVFHTESSIKAMLYFCDFTVSNQLLDWLYILFNDAFVKCSIAKQALKTQTV